MKETEIDAIIIRYESGICNSEEEMFLEQLANHNLSMQNSLELFKEEKDKNIVRERVIQSLRKEINPLKFWLSPVKIIIKSKPFLWVAAAVFLFASSFLLFLGNNGSETGKYHLFAKNENVNSEKKIQLPDGSVVTLKGESELYIHELFNENFREIKFEGKGFFEITRNEYKPFIIKSGGLVTSVLGTSFEINAKKDNREVEVKVFTGKVSVRLEESLAKVETEELVLTPNLKAVFDKKTKLIRETIVDNPSEIKANSRVRESIFKYEEMKISQIIKDIREVYGVEVILLNETCENQLFTGDLMSLTLYQKLNLICSVIGSDFETKGTKIIIKGKECN
jgi:ferric-dicitrate binding protein FerR (iron transport regulator)